MPGGFASRGCVALARGQLRRRLASPRGFEPRFASVKGMCPRPLDDGDAGLKNRSINRQKSGGARRDRTADLLHAMQALSQLSYGPTWRRGTLPDGDQFVKKMNGLRAPDGPRPGQARQGLGFSQNRQGGIDGRRYRPAADRQANGLRQLAERYPFGGRKAADERVNRRRRPVRQACRAPAEASPSSASTSGVTCLRTAFSS